MIKGLFAIIILLLVAYACSTESSVNPGLLKSLRAETGKCGRMMQGYRKSGLVQNVRSEPGSTTVVVEDHLWAASSHDLKVSVGLIAYCLDSPDDGRYSIYVKGYRDGAIKGSVSNGHWFSQ